MCPGIPFARTRRGRGRAPRRDRNCAVVPSDLCTCWLKKSQSAVPRVGTVLNFPRRTPCRSAIADACGSVRTRCAAGNEVRKSVSITCGRRRPPPKYFSHDLTIFREMVILKSMLKYLNIDSSFRALAEPTRRAIVERLSRGPATVSDLARPFDMTLAAVVQHLQVLEESGLVQSEKVGRVRTYQIEPGGLAPLADWVAERRSLMERRLDRLGELLAETEPSTQAEELDHSR